MIVFIRIFTAAVFTGAAIAVGLGIATARLRPGRDQPVSLHPEVLVAADRIARELRTRDGA